MEVQDTNNFLQRLLNMKLGGAASVSTQDNGFAEMLNFDVRPEEAAAEAKPALREDIKVDNNVDNKILRLKTTGMTSRIPLKKKMKNLYAGKIKRPERAMRSTTVRLLLGRLKIHHLVRLPRKNRLLRHNPAAQHLPGIRWLRPLIRRLRHLDRALRRRFPLRDREPFCRRFWECRS